MSHQSERTVTAIFAEWQALRLKLTSDPTLTEKAQDEAGIRTRALEFEAVQMQPVDALDAYRQIVMALTDALGEGDAGQPEAALYRRALSALGIVAQV